MLNQCEPIIPIPATDIARMSIVELKRLLSNEDCTALETKLSSAFSLGNRHLGNASYALLLRSGVMALREKLLTASELSACNFNVFEAILSHNGLIGLRESLFTLSELEKLGINALHMLFSDKGLVALREKLLVASDVAKMSITLLSILLTDKGLAALREGLFTVSDIVKLDHQVLEKSLSKYGLIGLRSGYITVSDASKLQDRGVNEFLVHALFFKPPNPLLPYSILRSIVKTSQDEDEFRALSQPQSQ
ncbi:MAG: hypothetical protein Q8R79_01925 [Legionellaceae bacterium]|nr:hypothetical protein [Legionellaceae bacterium]